ncbi:MAG TPA: hypothetical protein VGE21_07235 [Flavobacteriales bacterium]
MSPRAYLLALFFTASALPAQTGRTLLADTATVTVRQGGCKGTVSGERMRGLFMHEAVVVSRDGERHTYRGPLLRNVLITACPSVGALDKHGMVASAVKVMAADGFTAVIAGMEMDSTFQAKPVILAIDRDGAPLDGHQGPFQLIVPDDLRHSRNVRNVRSIELLKP